MTRVGWHRTSLLLVLCLAAALSLPAAELTFSYTDPIGDSTGTIDVTHMVVVFDNLTGNYKITLTSTVAQPFLGTFRVNINLFNPSRLQDHSFLQDVFNDYDLTTPKTKLVLTGNDPDLLHWIAGDGVATNTAASGGQNPPGSSLYRTGVPNLPLPGTFPLPEDNIAFGPTGLATISTLTAQGVVASLMDEVQVLLEAGVLTADQARGLMDKLVAALASLNREASKASCGQLGAFINQVEALIHSRALSVDQGQALIAAALALRNQVGCA
jgi:hypothetical protein